MKLTNLLPGGIRLGHQNHVDTSILYIHFMGAGPQLRLDLIRFETVHSAGNGIDGYTDGEPETENEIPGKPGTRLPGQNHFVRLVALELDDDVVVVLSTKLGGDGSPAVLLVVDGHFGAGGLAGNADSMARSANDRGTARRSEEKPCRRRQSHKPRCLGHFFVLPLWWEPWATPPH